MKISPGTRLGPYEVVSPIGAGGMGEVFRGRDTRLDRSVAIKVLSSHLSSNPQFRERFDREARAVSALNHPNICTLHDVGHQDGVDYIVMELLEGESLADRVTKGALPPEQVLRYGVQIAEGLDKAHRLGIVHRDLKPGNVMITKSGAKLLDFGLAKIVADPSAVSSATNMATAQKPLTQEGTILGTFQYMAPEQLEGEEADARTDIFALGAVLYEMATGRRAFVGKTKTSLIAAIVSSEPTPISQIQPLTPPALEHVIRKCLAKDRDDRWQSAHDIAEELKWISEAGSQAGVAAPFTLKRKSRERLAWALAAALLLSTAGFALLWRRATSEPLRRMETSILPPAQERFDFGFNNAVISPDGRRVVASSRGKDGKLQLWVRPLNGGSGQQLPGTENATYPFWSPDSRFVGFFGGGKMKKVDVSGGPPQTICEALNGRSGAWNRDGVIIFAPTDRDPLFRVPASGGTPVPITQLEDGKEYSHRWPLFLPDGKHYLYLAQNFSSVQERGRIYVSELGSKERKFLLSSNSPVSYSPPGYLLYYRDRALLAQRFDPKRLELAGDPFPIAENVQYYANTGSAVFSAAANGTLVYQQGGSGVLSRLVWRDRTGKELGVVGQPADFQRPRLSHDGRRVVVEVVDDKQGASDLWLFDLTRNTSSRFTFDATEENNALWSPDDRWIAFSQEQTSNARRNVVRKASSGAGEQETLFSSDFVILVTSDWTRDGRFIIFNGVNPKLRTGHDLWIYSFVDRKAIPFAQSRFNEGGGQVSPDVKWIAYTSNESGRQEVYIQEFPRPSGKWQVSTDGGNSIRWRGDGKELFYLSSDKLMAVDLKLGETVEAGIPRVLFELRTKAGFGFPYAVTPDGQRFLINTPINEEVSSPLTLIQNWAAELAP